MANQTIIAKKQEIVEEVKSKVKDATSVVLFDYRGLTDFETKEIRSALRENGASYKVYKNTLMKRAFNDLNIDINSSLEGPSALAYTNGDAVSPIKVLNDYAKEHPALVLKVGIVDGKVTDKDTLTQLAKLPSRDALLTMLAGSLIAIPKNLAIALDLYAKQKEEN